MRRALSSLLSLIVACAMPRGTGPGPPDSMPLVDPLLVLDADVVVEGRVALVSPRRLLREGRVDLYLDHLEVLKGDVPESRTPPICVHAWVDPAHPAWCPAPSFLSGVEGKRVIVLAGRTGIDNPVPGLHLAHDAASLQVHSSQLASALRTEIARQARLAKEFRGAPHARPDETDRAVAAKVDDLTRPGQTRNAVRDLLAMGCAAVPALIRQMDDERRYAAPEITFENRDPGAFESILHYAPQLVADAIAAMLNDVTGMSFGFISNGALPAERKRAIDKWRIWLALENGHPRCSP